MVITSAQVTPLLIDILGESAAQAAANAAQWVALGNLPSGAYDTPALLAAAMAASNEGAIAQEVTRLYEGILGRAPDIAGLQYWTGVAEASLTAAQRAALAAGGGGIAVSAATWTALAGGFLNSAEFLNAHQNVVTPTGFTPTAFITQLYDTLLGRVPDAAGLAYWLAQLSHGTSEATLAFDISASAESIVKNTALIQTLLVTGATTAHAPGAPLYATGTLPFPSYSIAANVPSVTEGGTVDFTVTTSHVAAGATLAYSISGVPRIDVVGGQVAGAVTIGMNGEAVIPVALISSAGQGLSGSLSLALTLPVGGVGTPSASVALVETPAAQNLTATVDTILMTQPDSRVVGTFNGAGATFTAGDAITAGSSALGAVLTLSDIGAKAETATANASTIAARVIDMPTVTIVDDGNVWFDAASPGGAVFTGLTQLNISAASAHDNANTQIAVGTATSVTLTDSDLGNQTDRVVGGAQIAIIASAALAAGVLQVSGGSVSVSVTENDGNVAAVTLTTPAPSVLLNGVGDSRINDSTLSSLTLSNANRRLTIATAAAGIGSTALTLNENTATTLVAAATATAPAAAAIIDSNHEITALTITLGTGASAPGIFSDSGLTDVTITGSGSLTEDFSGNKALLSIIDQSRAPSSLILGGGPVNFSGSGADIITLVAAGSGSLADGGGGTLIADFVGTATPGGSFGAVTGFSTLILGNSATVFASGAASSASGIFDLTGLKTLATVKVAAATSNDLTIQNVSAGTLLAFAGSDSGHFIYQAAGIVSSAAAVSVALASGATLAALDVYDSQKTGLSTLSLTSTGGVIANSITALDSMIVAGGLSALTVSGSAGVTIAGWSDAATSLTITGSGSLNSAANSYSISDASLSSLTMAGSGSAASMITLASILAVGAGTTTLADQAAGAVTINLVAAETALTALSIVDSATASLTIATAVSAPLLTAVTEINSGAALLSDAGLSGASLAIVTIGSGAGRGAGIVDTLISSGNAAGLTVTDKAAGAVTISTLLESAGGSVILQDSGSGSLHVNALTGGTEATLTLAATGAGSVTVAAGTLDSVVTLTMSNSGSGGVLDSGLTSAALTAVDFLAGGGMITDQLISTGMANVTVTDNDLGGMVSIANLVDSATASATVNFAGAGRMTVTALGAAADTLTVNDSASGGMVTLANLTDSAVGSTLVINNSGGGALIITPGASGVETTLTAAASGAGALTITAITGDAVLAAINLTNNGSGILTDGGVTDAALAAVNFVGSGTINDMLISSGAAMVSIADSATGPVTIAGLQDSAAGSTIVIGDSGGGALTVGFGGAGVETGLTVNDSGAGAVTLGAMVADAALATVTLTGAGTIVGTLLSSGAAALAVNDNATGGMATLSLVDSGTAPGVTLNNSGAGSLVIASLTDGTASSTLTVTNDGSTAAVTISSLTDSGVASTVSVTDSTAAAFTVTALGTAGLEVTLNCVVTGSGALTIGGGAVAVTQFTMTDSGDGALAIGSAVAPISAQAAATVAILTGSTGSGAVSAYIGDSAGLSVTIASGVTNPVTIGNGAGTVSVTAATTNAVAVSDGIAGDSKPFNVTIADIPQSSTVSGNIVSFGASHTVADNLTVGSSAGYNFNFISGVAGFEAQGLVTLTSAVAGTVKDTITFLNNAGVSVAATTIAAPSGGTAGLSSISDGFAAYSQSAVAGTFSAFSTTISGITTTWLLESLSATTGELVGIVGTHSFTATGAAGMVTIAS